MAVTVTNYDTVNGKIRTKWTGERPGSQAVFHDPLGSVVGIYEDGWLKADRVYDASGETRAEWNDVGTFGWVGGYGYRETRREWVSHYVRARHYSYMTGGWTSVDPLWPSEMAYEYVKHMYTSRVDYSGLQNPTGIEDSGFVPCGFREPYQPCSDLLAKVTPNKQDMQFLKCIRKAGRLNVAGIAKCMEKYRGSENFKLFLDYAACVYASSLDPSLNRTNPCKTVRTGRPGMVTVDNQTCCNTWVLRCLANCKSGRMCVAKFNKGLTDCYGQSAI